MLESVENRKENERKGVESVNRKRYDDSSKKISVAVTKTK